MGTKYLEFDGFVPKTGTAVLKGLRGHLRDTIVTIELPWVFVMKTVPRVGKSTAHMLREGEEGLTTTCEICES